MLEIKNLCLDSDLSQVTARLNSVKPRALLRFLSSNHLEKMQYVNKS